MIKIEGANSTVTATFNEPPKDGYKMELTGYNGLEDRDYPSEEEVKGSLHYGIGHSLPLLAEILIANNPEILKPLLEDRKLQVAVDLWGFLGGLHPESNSRELSTIAMAGLLAYSSAYIDRIIEDSGINLSYCIEQEDQLEHSVHSPCSIFTAIHRLVYKSIWFEDGTVPEIRMVITHDFAVAYNKRKFRLIDTTGDKYIEEERTVNRRDHTMGVGKEIMDMLDAKGIDRDRVQVLEARGSKDLKEVLEAMIKSLDTAERELRENSEDGDTYQVPSCEDRKKAIEHGVSLLGTYRSADSYNVLLNANIDVETAVSDCCLIDMGRPFNRHYIDGIKMLYNACGYVSHTSEDTGVNFIEVGDLGYLTDLWESEPLGGEEPKDVVLGILHALAHAMLAYIVNGEAMLEGANVYTGIYIHLDEDGERVEVSQLLYDTFHHSIVAGFLQKLQAGDAISAKVYIYNMEITKKH